MSFGTGGDRGGDNHALPFKKNLELDKEHNTPPTPKGGKSGGVSEQKTRKRIRREEDDPDLAEAARVVVAHYQARVRTTHPPGGAVVLVMRLLASGIAGAELRRRCDLYASNCNQNQSGPSMRQSAGNFFGPSGHHLSYEDDSAQECMPKPSLPPRPERRLNRPAVAQDAPRAAKPTGDPSAPLDAA